MGAGWGGIVTVRKARLKLCCLSCRHDFAHEDFCYRRRVRRSRHKYERQEDTNVSEGFTCRCSFRTRSTTLPAQPAILEAMSTERCRAASLVTFGPGPCARCRAASTRRPKKGTRDDIKMKIINAYRHCNTMPLYAWEYKNCLCIHVNNQTVHAFLDRRCM